jgi:DNA-binding protein H-NS
MAVMELLDLEAKLPKALALARERELANVKREITALAEKRGFTLCDLFGSRGKRKLVAPTYANPDNPSQTWTGRGRKPHWLVAKMKSGAKLQQFAL